MPDFTTNESKLGPIKCRVGRPDSGLSIEGSNLICSRLYSILTLQKSLTPLFPSKENWSHVRSLWALQFFLNVSFCTLATTPSIPIYRQITALLSPSCISGTLEQHYSNHLRPKYSKKSLDSKMFDDKIQIIVRGGERGHRISCFPKAKWRALFNCALLY